MVVKISNNTFAEEKMNVAQVMISVFYRKENIGTNGEDVDY